MITYQRQKIESSIFGGAEMYQSPELPMIKFKKGRATYKVTDLRCLNEQAVETFFELLTIVCNTPKCEEVTFRVRDIEENRLNLICDIITSVSLSRKTRYGDSWLRFLASGVRYQTSENDGNFLTFELDKEKAEIIYEYAQKQKDDTINFWELAVYVIDQTEKRMKEEAAENKVSLDTVFNTKI